MMNLLKENNSENKLAADPRGLSQTNGVFAQATCSGTDCMLFRHKYELFRKAMLFCLRKPGGAKIYATPGRGGKIVCVHQRLSSEHCERAAYTKAFGRG